MTRKNLLLFSAVVVAAIFAMAPSPGNVGGCGDEALIGEQEFCVPFFSNDCARVRFRCEAEDPDRVEECNRAAVDCVNEVQAVTCPGFTFPTGCQPTVTRANACFDAQLDVSRIDIPTSSLPECMFCPGARDAGPPPMDAGPGDGGMDGGGDGGPRDGGMDGAPTDARPDAPRDAAGDARG
jgi:hypothetical protein